MAFERPSAWLEDLSRSRVQPAAAVCNKRRAGALRAAPLPLSSSPRRAGLLGFFHYP